MGNCCAKNKYVVEDVKSGNTSSTNDDALISDNKAKPKDKTAGKESGVQRRFDGEVTVLVSDMQGFTRLTKKLGIVHFTSLILKMRSICKPVYEAYGALSITTEADNYFVVFPNPESAVAAAVEAREHLNAYNRGVTDDDFKPIIGGFGIGLGSDTILANNGHLYGEAFDVAFHLGEDVAEKGNILIDQKVYEKVKNAALVRDLNFERQSSEEEEGRMRLHYQVGGTIRAPKATPARGEPAAPARNAPPLEEISYQMLQRLANPSQRETIDRNIKAKFMKTVSIIVMGLDLPPLTEKYGVMHTLAKTHEIVRLVKGIAEQHKGMMIEETIYGFTTPEAAMSAALKMRHEITQYNTDKKEKDVIPLKGFGLHSGEMLFVEGSDIHWGDPVNTASKLGEDIAQAQEIFVTSEFFEKIVENTDFGTLQCDEYVFEISHVEITCYSVEDSRHPHHPHGASADHKELLAAKASHIKKFAGHKSVLVTDMSGFTRITRTLGIVHFASLILKMRQLLTPLFEHYNAVVIETEADDFFVVFNKVNEAVAAALVVYQLLEKYNRTVEDDNFKINIGGIGVGCGTQLIQDELTLKFYGKPFDSGFRLGENTAEGGEVLIDEEAYEIIRNDALFNEMRFEHKPDPEDDGPDPKMHYLIEGPFSKGSYHVDHFPPAPPLPAPNAVDADHFMSLILRRHHTDLPRVQMDDEVRSRYYQSATVVMAGLDAATITEAWGVHHMIEVKHKALSIIKATVEKHHGDCVEESLWVFRSNPDAVAAALEIKAAYLTHNASCPDNMRILFTGFGIHTGDLLVVKGTNVHWGDPVNTASKLGEDQAKEGELFITHPVYDSIKDLRPFKALHYEANTFTISKVELKCYKVTSDDKPAPFVSAKSNPALKGGASSKKPPASGPTSPEPVRGNSTPAARTPDPVRAPSPGTASRSTPSAAAKPPAKGSPAASPATKEKDVPRR